MNDTIAQDITNGMDELDEQGRNIVVGAVMVGFMMVGIYATSKFITQKVIDRKVARKIKQLEKEKKNSKDES